MQASEPSRRGLGAQTSCGVCTAHPAHPAAVAAPARRPACSPDRSRAALSTHARARLHRLGARFVVCAVAKGDRFAIARCAARRALDAVAGSADVECRCRETGLLRPCGRRAGDLCARGARARSVRHSGLLHTRKTRSRAHASGSICGRAHSSIRHCDTPPSTLAHASARERTHTANTRGRAHLRGRALGSLARSRSPTIVMAPRPAPAAC